MELYKWYKGDELPDRECDCVVVYRYLSHFQFYGKIEARIIIKKGFGKCKSDKGNYFIVNDDGKWILPKNVIVYMPIEFPKEVS